MTHERDTTRGRLIHAVRRRFRVMPEGAPPAFTRAPSEHRRGRFVVLGDLQRTSTLEIWRESNTKGRKALLEALTQEAPDFVALMGDLVFRGDSALDWAEFDELAGPLHAMDVPVLPVLGNHDYGLRPAKALRHFDARFPALLGRRYYSVSYGPLAIVFLDSNRRRMEAAVWDEQKRWYAGELRAADETPDVHGTLVLAHHPPFTNSTVTGDDPNVRTDLVPPFVAAKKTLALFSGHVHSYERFVREGKMFVVTGGGGAPRVRLKEGAKRRHADDLVTDASLRTLHYLVCELRDRELAVEVRGIDESRGTIGRIDAFVLPLAGASDEA